jgi:hypothetical protein
LKVLNVLLLYCAKLFHNFLPSFCPKPQKTVLSSESKAEFVRAMPSREKQLIGLKAKTLFAAVPARATRIQLAG